REFGVGGLVKELAVDEFAAGEGPVGAAAVDEFHLLGDIDDKGAGAVVPGEAEGVKPGDGPALDVVFIEGEVLDVGTGELVAEVAQEEVGVVAVLLAPLL